MKLIRLIVLFFLACLLTPMCMAQRYSDYYADSDVEGFLQWEMTHKANNQLGHFKKASNKGYKILHESAAWGILIIARPDSVVDRFHETLRPLHLGDSLPAREVGLLRRQFYASKKNVWLDPLLDQKMFTDKLLKGNHITVVYSMPLISGDRKTFYVLKNYTYNAFATGEFMINVYRKAGDAWKLLHAVSVGTY